MPRFYLQVYGCQMNQHEAGLVRTVLGRAGYEESEREEDADVLLMLTCAVRNHAEQRALGRLGSFRRLRAMRPGALIGVLGCMSRNLEQALTEDRLADLIAGPDQYRRLPELLARCRTGRTPLVALEQDGECYEGILPAPADGACGSVTVMRGCDNYCSYCVVPLVRGRERSRSPEQVLLEVRALARAGKKDVTLLGQNVLAYRHGETDFAALLEQVSRVPSLERVRFLTSHPKNVDRRLLETVARLDNVCPGLHLPVQSGSDRILGLMNRGYTREAYLARVALAREILPELGLTTDVMVGFPSETEEDFLDTLDLIRAVRFDFAYMFRFSVRPGTAAARLAPKVSEADASRRLTRLIETQNRITRERNAEMVGRTFEVLVEGRSPRGSDATARTRTNKVVVVSGPARVGETINCRVCSVRGWTPVGERV